MGRKRIVARKDESRRETAAQNFESERALSITLAALPGLVGAQPLDYPRRVIRLP